MLKVKFNVKKLCFEAVMAALFVVFDMISIKMGNNIKITFGGLPIIIAAVFFGPVSGMLVGLIGSLIGQMLSFGFTATTLLWVLPAGIRGLSMGLLFIALGRNFNLKCMGISVIISSLLVTVFNTLAIFVDSKIYGYYSLSVVFGMTAFRLASAIITSIAYVIILIPILKALKSRIYN